MKPRVIAFYLPQYHPFPENDLWWGKGFTEWTNVGKAKRLFIGHEQPKVPADLGYYDLRVPEVRELQAEYASRAGIEGFCYYHYWFGNKELMERPLNEVIKSKSPDYPFCICWANESWSNKFWNKDSTGSPKLLIEQKYLGPRDHELHFYHLLDAFKDYRYMRQDNRLIFVIYKPLSFQGVSDFIKQWRHLAVINDLPGFYFIGYTTDLESSSKILELGFDAVNINRLPSCLPKKNSISSLWRSIQMRVFHCPIIVKYKRAILHFDGIEDEDECIIPSIIPNWDHTPRSGFMGYLLHNSTPELFQVHVRRVFSRVKRKTNKLVFLKSWNEWGEGNYMEPDLKNGNQYIDSLREEIDHY